MGGECATDVLVNVSGSPNSKSWRTGARGTGKVGLLESSFKLGASPRRVHPSVEVAGEAIA